MNLRQLAYPISSPAYTVIRSLIVYWYLYRLYRYELYKNHRENQSNQGSEHSEHSGDQTFSYLAACARENIQDTGSAEILAKQKTVSRPKTKNNQETPSIKRFKENDSIRSKGYLTGILHQTGYEDSMNLYQAFNQNPVNFVDPFGKQHQVTVTPEGAEFERPMTVGEFWESLIEAGVSVEKALNIIAENTYYSKYFWDGSLVDRIKTHQMDLTLADSEARALGMEYNFTLKGPREQFGRLFRGEFKEFGKAALENIDRTFGDPENAALMFTGGVKYKGAKPYPILNKRGITQWKDPFTGRFVTAPIEGFVKRWGPLNGPGPLGKDVAKTFRSSTYNEIILKEYITLYRLYGGKSGKLGPYWSRTKPSGPLQAQLDSAILPEWGSTLQNVVKIRVPKGTKIYEGIAASQKGVKQPFVNLPGGGNQVFIPRVDLKWIIQ